HSGAPLVQAAWQVRGRSEVAQRHRHRGGLTRRTPPPSQLDVVLLKGEQQKQQTHRRRRQPTERQLPGAVGGNGLPEYARLKSRRRAARRPGSQLRLQWIPVDHRSLLSNKLSVFAGRIGNGPPPCSG